MVRTSPRNKRTAQIGDFESLKESPVEPPSKRQKSGVAASTAAASAKDAANEDGEEKVIRDQVPHVEEAPRGAKVANGAQSEKARPKKKLILNAFVEMCSGHQSPGLWKHPDDESHKFGDVHHWIRLAKLLEDAHFHGMFIADVLGGYDVYTQSLNPAIRSGAQFPVNEPLVLLPALAAATHSLGLAVTVSTTYEHPYHLARRLSTVDHLTNGRIGWNIVTSYLDSAARNMLTPGTGIAPSASDNPKPPIAIPTTKQIAHDDRYAQAQEYLRVIYKLLESSWRSDTPTLSPSRNLYTDPTLVRQINHTGQFFTVPGPHLCAPSPQRTPLLLQAGTSSSGRRFAAEHAEGVFVSAFGPEVVKKPIAEIRRMAREEFGRTSPVKVLALVTVVIASTDAEAQAKLAEFEQYADLEGALALFGGWTGVDMSVYADDEELREVQSEAVRSTAQAYARFSSASGKWTKSRLARHISIGGNGPVLVGSPGTVADALEEWVREADVDGFNFAYVVMPKSFEDVVELLLPELKRRGLFWEGYAVEGGTYRENWYGVEGQRLPPEDHVSSRYRWREGVGREDVVIPEG